MNFYVVDAFAEQMFCGNQAGVVILNKESSFPNEKLMIQIAAELKHSETAFLLPKDTNSFYIRYFTPTEEVDLCGHATIAAFSMMLQEKIIKNGEFDLFTTKDTLQISVKDDSIWMDMSTPELIYHFTKEESIQIYEAYGLCADDIPEKMLPQIISTGLADIIMPVKNNEALMRAKQEKEKVNKLSKKYNVIGIHMFACDMQEDKYTARCRNFAPYVGIDEESATGTANGALTYYLYLDNKIKLEKVNEFLQGEAMGKPSIIKSIVKMQDGKEKIKIGGTAKISMKGNLLINE